MATEQAHPAQARAHAFGAKKIFVAERGIFADGHTVGIQVRTGQNPHIKTADLHGPPKSSLQMRNQIGMHTVGAHKKRHPDLQGDQQAHHRQRRFPPLSQYGHLARKFRRLTRKKVGASLDAERSDGLARPYFPYAGLES